MWTEWAEASLLSNAAGGADVGHRRAKKNVFDEMSEFAVEQRILGKVINLEARQEERSTATREPTSEYLSRAQVEEVLLALTAAEQTALMKIANVYSKKTSFSGEDLLQESIARVLDPTRRAWPRGLQPVRFLAGVAKSIAHDWRVRIPSENYRMEGVTGDRENITRADVDTYGFTSDVRAVERGEISKIDIGKVIALFADDPLAQQVLLSRCMGRTREEIQRLLSLDSIQYETKQKKIRRRIEKLFEGSGYD